jgi:hypothetical protein
MPNVGFTLEATKYQIFPLDDSLLGRFISEQPSYSHGRTVFTCSGELRNVPFPETGSAPSLLKPLVQDHGRGRHSPGRRRGRADGRRWPVRRRRLLSAREPARAPQGIRVNQDIEQALDDGFGVAALALDAIGVSQRQHR